MEDVPGPSTLHESQGAPFQVMQPVPLPEGTQGASTGQEGFFLAPERTERARTPTAVRVNRDRLEILQGQIEEMEDLLKKFGITTASNTSTRLSTREFASQFARLCKPPDVFEGKRAVTTLFLHQIRLYFAANNTIFAEDRRKVDYALMLMRGTAGDWALPLVQRREVAEAQGSPIPPELISWTAFEKAIQNQFGTMNEEEQASDAILTIRQGDRMKASEYTTRFLTLRNKLPSWHESTFIHIYFRGLRYSLQKNLISSWGTEDRRPKILGELARQAVEAEGLFDVYLKRQDATPHGGSHTVATAPKPQPHVAANDSDVMQLDFIRSKLTDHELTRRKKEGLCFNCGHKGHVSKYCRKRIREAKQAREASKAGERKN